MTKSRILWVLLALLVPASFARADSVTIRTGQVGSGPGTCNQVENSFHYYTPNQQCGQPILPTPFSSYDFDQACSGPYAVVAVPYTPVWVGELACDPLARWIAPSVDPGSCFGAPLSVLYCAQFSLESQCTLADSIRVCWAADDFLGDQPSWPGPNPGGVYVNGVSLGPAFSGPGADQQYSAVAYNVPLNAGSNSLAVYQRDAGCGISGLILSCTVYAGCGPTPTEQRSWGSIKAKYGE
jgi:hypothetical protein